MAIVTTKSGDTIDSICFDYYGYTVGMNEKVLEANQGLAALGAPLPAGTQIIMPAISSSATQTNTLVQLWD